jgi:hypothetical protein
MRPGRQKSKVLLAVALSLCVLFLFPYSHFYNLAEADFLCTSPHLENPFSDGFLSSLKGKWDFMKWSDRPMIFSPEKSPSRCFTPRTFSNFFPVEKVSPLRC